MAGVRTHSYVAGRLSSVRMSVVKIRKVRVRVHQRLVYMDVDMRLAAVP